MKPYSHGQYHDAKYMLRWLADDGKELANYQIIIVID